MKCICLCKENFNVYMTDENGFKLDLENNFKIQKYEKDNNVNIIEIVNSFFSSKDDNFNKIITDIESLVEEYKIDYFIYGEGKEVSQEGLAIIYNLKNRKSCIDCILKVIYNPEKFSVTNYLIEFSEGSSGSYFGYSFYRFFDSSSFYSIKILLERYFSSNDAGSEDIRVIKECIDNVENRLKYYYSK